VKRILLTGMSAVGKSTLVDELRRRGFRAVDLDGPDWSEHGPLDDGARELVGSSGGGSIWSREGSFASATTSAFDNV
jgi:GTPase SAR1 family protein